MMPTVTKRARVMSDGIFTWFIVTTAANAAATRLRFSMRVKAVMAMTVIVVGASASIVNQVEPKPLPAVSGSLARFTVAFLTWSASPAVRFDVSDPSVFRCNYPAGESMLPTAGLPRTTRRNVLLVSVESLRLDHVGKHIQGRPVTPHFSSFAQEAQDFRRAHTTYPATLFSMASAFTGYYPSIALFSPQPPKSITVRARDNFDEIHLLLPDDQWFDLPALDFWIFQGVAPSRHPDAGSQTSRALEILAKARERNSSVFLWLHYYEPHQPYRLHGEFDFGKSAPMAYASELALVDSEFGRLSEHLERNGWLDDSLVMVFADHGQALGESGYFGHHVYLTAELTAIPLLVRHPSSQAGPRETLVSIADIAPTILHFLGLPVPADLDGMSLLLPDRRRERDHVIAEAFPLRGSQLFEFAARPLGGLEGLREKISIVQTNRGSYSPKVALIDRKNRLIVDRVTGAVELYEEGDNGSRNNSSVDHSKMKAMLYKLSEWHFQVSERSYCANTMAAESAR